MHQIIHPIYSKQLKMATYQVETTPFVKTRANHGKKSGLNSQKKITYVDDIMIHNLVKYLVQTRLCL
jgi:hypothetical protein